MAPLDADQLDAFWHVVQEGGFHQAAAALHLSQPAVTQRVRALEAELGLRLFVRAGRGVALTDAGRTLLGHCRAVRQAEAALRQALGAGPEGLAGRLAVAAGTAEGLSWVVPALAALGRANPGLEIALALHDPPDPAALLASGRCDVVVAELPARGKGFASRRLREVAYVLVAAPALAAGWPDDPPLELLLGARAIDFAPTDRITFEHLARCFPGADLSGLRRHYADDTPAIVRWTLAGGGWAVLPRAMVAEHLERGTLRLLQPERESRRTLYWSAPAGMLAPAAEQLLISLLNQSD